MIPQCKWCDKVLAKTKGGAMVCGHCDNLCGTGPANAPINALGCAMCARLSRRSGF